MDRQITPSPRTNQSFWLGFGGAMLIALLIVALAGLALGPMQAGFVLAGGLALAIGYGVR